MNSKLYQLLMIVPIYFLAGFGGISHNIDASISSDENQVFLGKSGENNRDWLISARDDQNDKNKSCLLTGNCTL